jgi:hypothetical protein
VVVPPDHVGDPHVDVVDDHHEVVRGRAVAAGQDEILQLAVVERDLPFDDIGHRRASRRHEKADRVGAVDVAPDVLPAAAVVLRRFAGRHLYLAPLFEFLRRAGAAVRLSGLQQLVKLRAVEIGAFALEERPFVPGEAEPLHPVENRRSRLRCGALFVGVLDPKEEDPVMPPRVKIVEERGPGPPDMEVAGGAGCKANPGSLRRRHIIPFISMA